ncbi:hypothetical protein TorRG33x02_186620 [Trema orientale]|uniref:Uncharacterized protein n=1 Tax=Trema orientale TaxID=63057 RepID=A0A2P5EJ47_TREOI|nr:hypothetical protein TorRG33x02_186620 [Trema orientale]
MLRVTEPEICWQRWEEVLRIRIGIVYLHSETVFDINQVQNESDATDDDEQGPIIGNAQKKGKVGGSGEEEAIGAEEVGGEAEPEVGDGVKGEGLVFMLCKSLIKLFICPEFTRCRYSRI